MATVSIDYATQGPIATDDSVSGQITNTAVTVTVLTNDSDPDGTLDVSTVSLTSGDVNSNGKTQTVTGEGVWTVNALGTITFTPEAGFTADPTPVDYTVKDNDGNESNVATVSIDYVDLPVIVKNVILNVSEEGLSNGLTDTIGISGNADGTVDVTDTTNSTSDSASMNFIDPEGEAVSATLIAPTETLTSGDVVIVWSGEGTDTLTGKAGINGSDVITIHVDNTGKVTVDLLDKVDHPLNSIEDVVSLNIEVNVSDGVNNTVGKVTVNIEDDAPIAADSTAIIEVKSLNTNLMIILDTSGSMADNADGTDGTNKSSRLDLAKASISKLIADYGELGSVMVQLVTFDTTADEGSNTWMNASDALSLLNGLSAGGYTNYDDALAKAITTFNTQGSIDDAQNISYFFSDGVPYPAENGIDNTEVLAWESFLRGEDITSYAIGLGKNVTSGDLNPVAYDGALNQDKNADIVDDLNDLDDLLSSTVNPVTVTGNLYTEGYGADGGRSLSVTLNVKINDTDTEVTYTYNLANNEITNSINSDVSSGSILIVANSQANVEINMLDGSYAYQSVGSSSVGDSDQISYTLTDNDGDNATGTLHFSYEESTDPVAIDDYVLSAGNGAGLRSEYYAYQEGSGANDDGANLERIDQIKAFIAANDPNATFIAKDIHYNNFTIDGNGDRVNDRGDLGGDNSNGTGETNLEIFLGDDVDSLIVHHQEESKDAIIKMYGLIDLDAGNYKFKVNSDDGYSIVIDGVEVARVDRIQAPTVTSHPEFTIAASGMHTIEILYWDQEGHYVFEPTLKEVGGPYLTLTSDNYDLFQAYQAQSGSDLSITISDLLANDYDPQGDVLVLTGLSDKQHGTAVVSGDQIVFTPDAGYQGQASFSYSISVGNGGTDTATVYLTIEPETILGNTGNENANLITAGLGDDIMTGNGGADTFMFNVSDTVETDTVIDFSQLEGDKLDLSDMLDGENAANLDDYLSFSQSGSDTLVEVKFDGSGSVDQKILLKNVDLTDSGNNSDSQIIQDLIDNNNIIIDQ